jgi:hypothetical protein
MLLDFFKGRQQAILLKAFSLVRQFQPNKVAPSARKTPYNATKRTVGTTILSDNSPIREAQMRTIRSQAGISSRLELDCSKLNQQEANLMELLDRVKLANSRSQGTYSFRNDQHAHYEPEYPQHHSYYIQYVPDSPSSHRLTKNPTLSLYNPNLTENLNRKNSRRQFILSKFNRIENQLEVLGAEKGRGRSRILSNEIMGEIYNMKERLRL